MSFTPIERAYELLLANIHHIQTRLATHFYDALIEQNAYYLGAEGADEELTANNAKLKELNLSPEDWRRVYQFLLIKAAQTDKLQANHQFTPDSIGFLLAFLVDSLIEQQSLDVLEIGSGTGHLAFTLLTTTAKQLDYLGIELDDLLIDLSASMAEVMNLPLHLVQEDAVRPQVLKESDLILSDLPVGYYPDDQTASRYQVAASEGHTYAHHLLMEQSLKYLKPDGLAIFLAPTDLLTSEQAPLLKNWLNSKASLLMVLTLPEQLFGANSTPKAIFVLKKQVDHPKQTLVYHLSDLRHQDVLLAFMTAVKEWQAS